MIDKIYNPRIAVIALFFTGGIANAQNQSSLEEVSVIGTRSEQSIEDIPANVSLLNTAELNKVSPIHIQQALSRVPGVSMQRGNGQESLPAIRSAVLTGAGACGSVLILEESIPVRGAGFCNINELFDTHFEHASQVEVVRGPNTAFYGSNALNGSVNVNLASAGQDAVSIELGSSNFARVKGAVSYGDKQENQGRLYLSVSDDGGFREDSGYQQQKFSWRHQTQLTDWSLKSGLTYTNLEQETAGFIVGLDSYRDSALARQNPTPEAFRETNSLRAWLKGERAINKSSEFQGALYLRDTEMDFLQHFLPGDPLEKNAQTGFGLQTAIVINAVDSAQWTIGFDAEINDGKLQQTQDEPTRGSAFLIATIPTGTHYDYEVRSEQMALFTHLDWQLSTKWKLVTGLRLEKIAYDYDNLSLDGRTRDDGSECGFGGCRYSRPADSKDSFTHLSPKFELRHQASEQWRFSLTLANSFRAPQATELYRLQREQTVADLDIVDVLSLEFATKYTSETLELNASAYYSQSDNLIIRDSNFFNVDGQSTISTGVELSLQHQLSETLQWRLIASAADHEYSSDQILNDININGNQVDTAPTLFGSVFLNWALSNKISTELELQHISSYYLDPENQHKYPGHTLVNAKASYDISDSLDLSVRASNLADRRYADRADFTTFTDERYFPGVPRSVFMELTYLF